MKTTIGGDRLGSGNKQNVSLRNYERSTHDLSYTWRSSMAVGTLVPFMSELALPGDSWDIDLNCEVLTLPTIGPLFGSMKVQLDVFQIPIRLYNASLHMNKLGIGMEMSNVFLPKIGVWVADTDRLPQGIFPLDDNAQVNPSSLMSYLGVRGIGKKATPASLNRNFNGVPYLGYWDIYKNYYANKQEERGFALHMSSAILAERMAVEGARLYQNADSVDLGDCFNINVQVDSLNVFIVVQFGLDALEPIGDTIQVIHDGGAAEDIQPYVSGAYVWDNDEKTLTIPLTLESGIHQWQIPTQNAEFNLTDVEFAPSVVEFDLNNIDLMREKILQADTSLPFYVADELYYPYNFNREFTLFEDNSVIYSTMFSQNGLALKTYQSDLFNNWISTEWIDGANGINAVTAVDTTGDSFTIDALNLANKVYNMLNRIAISGGTYDDWLDAVYTHERTRSVESPMYLGSLIKELAFQEVVSTVGTDAGQGGGDFGNPLGTLAGRGRLTNKNKGGKIKVKVDEPSYIMGLVSLTPRIDYSQGNKWDVNLDTMNDFHKPALDAIGYQDLITEQMAWQSTDIAVDRTLTTRSAGKQPAWINYMTAVNRTYGNFADLNKDMFMTLNRRYEIETDGSIQDLTTYIDPSKFNFIFAQTSLDAQNFWVQISNSITARRKMSAKVIPNL